MPSYEEWNDALIYYYTTGASKGSSVFLDVNDDSLEYIGLYKLSMSSSAKNIIDDFKQAVREKCIAEGQVNVQHLYTQGEDTRPLGVAFLGAMVLAAYRMEDNEGIAGINYFTRLQEVLGLENGAGRPEGMKQKEELKLWLEWNVWLQKQGFLPTAREGHSRTNAYINYPISQSLIRYADRDILERLFEGKKWPTRLDKHLVTAKARQDISLLSKHLQQLLQGGSAQRFNAVADAIFGIYEDWVSFGRSSFTKRERIKRNTKRNLNAGIYRTVDLFSNAVEYWLYPRQPQHYKIPNLKVKYFDEFVELEEYGYKWYNPLWALSVQELENGSQYELADNGRFQEVVLPKRDFWILSLDPDAPESGAYISGENLELGTPFLFLCKKDLQRQMDILKNERLIQWKGEPRSLSHYPGWVEYQDVMVLSEAWDGVSHMIKDKDLYESLRPLPTPLSIHLEGGIRLPKSDAWLAGYGPGIKLVSFDQLAHLSIHAIGHEEKIVDKNVPTDVKLPVVWPGAGDYFIEALVESGSSTESTPIAKIVKIVSWDQLPMAPLKQYTGIRIGTWQLYGSLIQSTEGAS